MRILYAALIVVVFSPISCISHGPATAESPRFFLVMDSADILTPQQEDSITTVTGALQADIGSQVVVLTIKSLAGEHIDTYSLRTANELKLGRATHNDGVLITVAYDDRRVRIEVGTGLERIISDEIAARIVREDAAPLFRKEKFGQGLFVATEKISDLIRKNKDQIGQ